jgi:threonine dehydrogenase-like Zn-dependent dehydrogenase
MYETLTAFMGEATHGHGPRGVVEEVGAIKPGDRVVIPFVMSGGHAASCATRELFSQYETTRVRDRGTGGALFGFSGLHLGTRSTGPYPRP